MSDQLLIEYYKAQMKLATAKADLDHYLENDHEYLKLKRDLKLAKMEAEIFTQHIYDHAEKTYARQTHMEFLDREAARSPKIEIKHFEEP